MKLKFSIPRGWSDLLKIVACILVALSHYHNIKAASAGQTLNSIELLIRSMGGNIGVAVFFFLSGYGLMMSELKSHLPFNLYFKRRFLKVYLPVVLITAIWLPIAYSIDIYSINYGGGYLSDNQRFIDRIL